MNLFDMRTIVFSYVISNAVCLIVMAFLWLGNRRRFAGLGLWWTDFAMQFIALSLVALRGEVPEILSIVVSNGLVIAGTILLYMGLQRFVGKRSSQLHNYFLLAVFILVHTYFTYVQPSLLIRTINLSVGMILICAQCAWLLVRGVDTNLRPLTSGVGAIFVAFCLTAFARIFVDLLVSPGNDFFRSDLFEALATLTNQTLFIILTFSLLLMVNRRLVADLEKDIAEREQTEERQQLERARWQSIVEGMADEVWTCDAEGKMSLLNLGQVTSMGLDVFDEKSVEDVYQMVEILYPDGQPRPPEQAPLLRSLKGQIVRGEEIMRHRLTGRTRYRQFSSSPIINSNGTLTGAVAIVRDITEQKAAEEGLRRFELLSKHSRDIILFIRHEDGHILDANMAAVQAYGYDLDELLALSIQDLRAPDTQNLTAEQMAQADTGGILFETIHRRKDGTTFPVEVSSQGAVMGGVRSLVSIIRDITERKLMEQALLDSEARYRGLVESQRDLIVRVDPQGRFTFVNDAYCHKFGLKREEILGQETYQPLVHPEDLPNTLEAMKALYQPPYRVIVEQRAFSIEGIRWIEWQDSAIQDEAGRIVEIQAIGRDITARKQAEDRLRESEEKQRLFIEHAPAALAMFDREMCYLAVSHRWLADYKLTGADIIGRSHYEVFPEIPERWKQIYQQGLAGEVIRADADAFQRMDGSVQMLKWEVRPWYTASGDVGGIVIFSEDVTERKQAEEQRTMLANRLHLATSAARIGIWDWDIQKNQLLWDDQMYALYGLRPGEFGGAYEAFLSGLHPDDRRATDAAVQQAIRGEREYSIEFRAIWPDKSIHWIKANGDVFCDEHGKPIRMVGVNYDITERKQAEETLRSNEAMLRGILDQMPSGVTVRDAHTGTLILSNARSQEIMGALVDSANQFAQYQGFHPDGHLYQAEEWPLSRSMSTGEVVHAEEIIYERTNGVRTTLSINAAPVRDQQGRIVMGVAVFDDITERKLAERNLQESEERFRAISEISLVAVGVMSMAGQPLFVNKAYERLFGYTREEAMRKKASDLYWDPEERQKWLPSFQEKGLLRDYEVKLKRKDGTAFWALLSVAPINFDGQQAMMGTVMDISERKQIEDELRASEERLRLSLQAANQGLYDLNVQTGATIVNDEYAKMLGYDPETFVETNAAWIQRLHPDDVEVTAKAYRDYTAGLLPEYRIEFRQKTKDGGWKWILSLGRVVEYDSQGRPLRMLGTHTDITERKHAEEELRRTLEELKHSNAELEEFAYVASHDLQEPLRGIAGLIQLLQIRYKGQLDSRADEYIDHIVDGAQRMQTLINDLLAYSRIGRRGETIQSIEAGTALKAALKNLNAAILEVDARVTSEDLPKVKADTTQLVQLFQNLIGNAIKFRRENPPEIHIEVADAGDFWQFRVQDNGIGIESQYFERIFQVFQRLHTRREYKGTGIGLAICKKIIERHGGHIWVESIAGQGSTFYFTLPKGEQH